MAEKKTDKRQAARQSLISAAASAEASQTKAQALDMQTGVGTFIQRKKEYDKKRKELEDAANKNLNTDVDETKLKEEVKDEFKDIKYKITMTDIPSDRSYLKSVASDKVNEINQYLQYKDDLSEIFLDEMEYDGDNFIYDQIKEFIDGTAVRHNVDRLPDEPDTDEYGFEKDQQQLVASSVIKFSDGSEIPLSQFKQEVEKLKIDRDSQKSLTALVSDVTNLADNQQSANFDYVKYQNKVSQIINNKDTSLYSLANHKLLNGNSFKDHMIQALETANYGDLGLSLEEAKELDPTPNTKITSEDAEKITKTLIENEDDMLKDYLTKYYTDVLQLQHEINTPKAENITNQNTVTAENTNVETTQQGPLNVYNRNTTL
tara:strand:- start:6357 stop:7481 length:1125 start_codon:yes stop_codon:yes gene_type:complete